MASQRFPKCTSSECRNVLNFIENWIYIFCKAIFTKEFIYKGSIRQIDDDKWTMRFESNNGNNPNDNNRSSNNNDNHNIKIGNAGNRYSYGKGNMHCLGIVISCSWISYKSTALRLSPRWKCFRLVKLRKILILIAIIIK